MTKILGVALVVVGLVLALTTMMRLDRDDVSGRTAASARSGPEGAVVLPLVAGLSFASGIVLLVVGVGRWSHPRTRPEPGDAVVDPEAHHKMDHV
jgi:hypothetical protein